MYPRHWIDISAAQVAHGFVACLTARRRGAERALLADCGLTECGLAALSVRSAWDLLLGVVDWPAGSEVIVSAIGHPDMVRLIVAHGYVPIPIDIDPDTLLPDPAALLAVLTPRTKAVLVVQLFGGRGDLARLAAVARMHRLLLVEDAAQAFAGPDSLAPVPGVDVSLVSFGMIKTATAGGGALTVVADPELLDLLRAAHDRWPLQSVGAYRWRLLRLAAMRVLSGRAALAALFWLCRRAHVDIERLIGAIGRSQAGDLRRLLDGVRQRPSEPLLVVMRHRIGTFDADRLDRRRELGEWLAAHLPAEAYHPGGRQERRTHWIFPVTVAPAADVVAALRAAGIDAASATSNLVVAGPGLPMAAAVLDGVVYLPAYPELPVAAREKLLAVVAETTA